MNKSSKKFYLFDRITQEKTEITYEKLTGILGTTKSSLANYKREQTKIKSINCYFLESTVSRKQLDELAQKEIIEKELWKPVTGTSRKYEASNYGRVREKMEDGTYKILHIVQKKMGAYVCIDKKTIILSRLIYKTFSCKDVKNKFIYHKDGNKSNNCYYNLCEESEWKNIRKLATPRDKPVIRIDPVTGEKEYFESMTEAAKESFVSPSLVSLAVKQGEIRGGYIWERDDIKI